MGNIYRAHFFDKISSQPLRGIKRQILASNASVQEVRNFDTLPSSNILVLNLYSTAYFELSKKYNVLFIEDDLLNPGFYSDTDLNTVHISQLSSTIERLMLPADNCPK